MNRIDFIIILLALAVALRGLAAGFLRQIGSWGGFALGLLLGALVAPWAASSFAPGLSRSLIVLMVFFGVALTLGGLGETLGHHLAMLAHRLRLGVVDRLLGAALGLGVTVIAIWLMASAFARSAGPVLAAELQASRILQTLDRTLPPAPDVMARLDRALAAGNIPRVFAGLEPAPAPPVTGPNAAAVTAAAAAGRAATVRIESEGCGGLLEGSGFVAGPGLVATNAHVVAGIDHPVVIDGRGPHPAQVVVFDPNLDFAVLRTAGLAAPPLPLAPAAVPRGTIGAALGYPGGGSFTVSPAAVLEQQVAVGRNIYDAGLVKRDIYTLQAVVRPGNSGGPLITPEGTVVGVIFATSTVNGQVGYALTSAEVLPDLHRAASAGPVATGGCIAE